MLFENLRAGVSLVNKSGFPLHVTRRLPASILSLFPKDLRWLPMLLRSSNWNSATLRKFDFIHASFGTEPGRYPVSWRGCTCSLLDYRSKRRPSPPLATIRCCSAGCPDAGIRFLNRQVRDTMSHFADEYVAINWVIGNTRNSHPRQVTPGCRPCGSQEPRFRNSAFQRVGDYTAK